MENSLYEAPSLKVVEIHPRTCLATSNEGYTVKEEYDPENESEEDW